MPQHIQQHAIDSSRMTFGYRSHGVRTSLPLLLIHGSFATGRWWEPLMMLLPDDIWSVAPDMRGCGQSEKSATGYAFEEQAQDLNAFVDALHMDNIDLVAHSSGAATAIEFALNNLDRLSSLILVDPAPPEGIHTPTDGLVALEQMRTDRTLLSQGLATMMPTLNQGSGEESGVDSAENASNARFFSLLVHDATEQSPAAFTATANALNHWNRFGDARRLTLPTVIIWGDQDQIVSREAMTRTLLAIPGANNLEVMRGVGHSPMIEAPLRLAELLVDFITQDFAGYESIHDRAGDQVDWDPGLSGDRAP